VLPHLASRGVQVLVVRAHARRGHAGVTRVAERGSASGRLVIAMGRRQLCTPRAGARYVPLLGSPRAPGVLTTSCKTMLRRSTPPSRGAGRTSGRPASCTAPPPGSWRGFELNEWCGASSTPRPIISEWARKRRSVDPPGFGLRRPDHRHRAWRRWDRAGDPCATYDADRDPSFTGRLGFEVERADAAPTRMSDPGQLPVAPCTVP